MSDKKQNNLKKYYTKNLQSDLQYQINKQKNDKNDRTNTSRFSSNESRQNLSNSSKKNIAYSRQKLHKTFKNNQNAHQQKIPLCCRTYLFDEEIIPARADKRTQYKLGSFPFMPHNLQTYKKTICVFLNTVGGEMYIGIKETTNKKYRYVLGYYLTQEDKSTIIQNFRIICQSIYPLLPCQLEIEFIPIRESPFPFPTLKFAEDFKNYGMSEMKINLDKYPYKPARYVIRVRVPIGNPDSLYSFIETQCRLNKDSKANQFIPFRVDSETNVKQISQDVLKKFKDVLLNGRQKNIGKHIGNCPKPQLGIQRHFAEDIDLSQINLTYQNLDTINFPKKEQETINLKKYHQKQSKRMISIEEQQEILSRLSLTFIAQNILQERLQEAIRQTSASQYTNIRAIKNQINSKQDFVLIEVSNQRHMKEFTRISLKLKLKDRVYKNLINFFTLKNKKQAIIRINTLKNCLHKKQILFSKKFSLLISFLLDIDEFNVFIELFHQATIKVNYLKIGQIDFIEQQREFESVHSLRIFQKLKYSKDLLDSIFA